MDTPDSVINMLDKFGRSLPPHKRKRIEMACVIHATSTEGIAQELEELARTAREGGIGYCGHGGGYYISISYACCKRNVSKVKR